MCILTNSLKIKTYFPNFFSFFVKSDLTLPYYNQQQKRKSIILNNFGWPGLQQQQQRRHIKKALGRGAAALGSWTRLVPASGEASASASAFVACVHAPVLCWGKGFPGTNGGRCT